ICVQLIIAHSLFCVGGQIIGVTINSLGRVLMICHPTREITKTVDELSYVKIILIQYLPPLALAVWILFGQQRSWFEYKGSLNRVARVTPEAAVQFNSSIFLFASIFGTI
ncbi:hypothetical protein PFISCL1PPCAC_13530, partial [Pristionchus fissidentatus]